MPGPLDPLTTNIRFDGSLFPTMRPCSSVMVRWKPLEKSHGRKNAPLRSVRLPIHGAVRRYNLSGDMKRYVFADRIREFVQGERDANAVLDWSPVV